ncbi:malto-oligosyltrehalose synthase [Agrobacterium pusense]|uniref:malto-oligosyltrehalose synthase n=1 Tax=Agrobacterium pusense TaxID=648995 RepID=UPI001C6E71E8|nr:malto-oligosyltrehalose synthase [Agrobacterium pusense]MBW9070035.1 malto-oligosyltrehalose synthase [Agrobacterium pusense]MBW9085125.1 malto-oligosyltrehalose synthase [Agrobacterium pusense]MBW9125400.1 malto-oligosyltrehalose synthase [Agrobacterium pusense]MBW9137815.1 malto-oligosyltrehalose synthase [Agrobacterium pusense]
MTIPTATYRLQFRNGMTFDRAAALAPYWRRLGISHLYASPIFTAAPGSTHGYDVTNPNEIDPAIGGRDGFDRMVAALKNEGLGLILDIVPNHMAASLDNPWWYDVIKNGIHSPHARIFDIDWSRRLTLPFLGESFEHALQAGNISITADPITGKPSFAYHDSYYPIAPETREDRLPATVHFLNNADIATLHDRQPYQLTSWRTARHNLSYRRFFEITGLVGVRVEDDAVFDATHQLILELVRSGAVDGLRIDHVDGLADPKAYLDRLRLKVGQDCYLLVEKILADGEHVPADWPVSGTTGYEFIAALLDALVDGGKLEMLRGSYEAFCGQKTDLDGEVRAAKLLMINHNFEGEFSTLLQLATTVAQKEGKDLILSDLETALRELLVAFPVYRTYGTRERLSGEDEALLGAIADSARVHLTAPGETALAFIISILKGSVCDAAAFLAGEFRVLFQQLTGPLMAKSIEDTLFFRQHMALALNEVGADPLPRPFALWRFHEAMADRLKRQPDGLSSTSTHDTKRGEDARARLSTLSEAPEIWAANVARWCDTNRTMIAEMDDGPAPEPPVQWMLYQALAGVWPAEPGVPTGSELDALQARFLVYVEKSLREAKLRTNWGDNNDAYERAVLAYASNLFAPENSVFLKDFVHSIQPFVMAGLRNSLSQTIIKLTAPGVPDIYQGSESLDLSLVDPDNRRALPFEQLHSRLEESAAIDFSCEDEMRNGVTKQRVICRILELRRRHPDLFRRGNYEPLLDGSPSIVSYARTHRNQAVIVMIPRLGLQQLLGNRQIKAGGQSKRGSLPASLRGVFTDVLSGCTYHAGEMESLPLVEHPFFVFSRQNTA